MFCVPLGGGYLVLPVYIVSPESKLREKRHMLVGEQFGVIYAYYRISDAKCLYVGKCMSTGGFEAALATRHKYHRCRRRGNGGILFDDVLHQESQDIELLVIKTVMVKLSRDLDTLETEEIIRLKPEYNVNKRRRKWFTSCKER